MNEIKKGETSVAYRVGFAFLIAAFALTFAGYLSEIVFKNWGWGSNIRNLLKAFIHTAIIITAVWYLRKKLDKGSPKLIGLTAFKKSLINFLFGFGLFAVPLLITLFCLILFGWGSVQINFKNGMLESFALGLTTVFFFEALPEELMFRGYIYSNLNIRYKRWVSILVTVVLFALLPVAVVPIQKLLGMDIMVGKFNQIEFSYIVNMFFFGFFQNYLRVLTGGIWASVGFHLIFVYINHNLIGLEPENFIQLSGITSEGPLQIILISFLLLVFLGLILYPIITKRKMGWNETKQ